MVSVRSTFIQCIPKLRVLNLAGSKIGIKGGQMISSALDSLQNLEEVHVQDNMLSNKGVVLFLGVAKKKKLTALSIDKNSADSKIGPFLCDMVLHNSKLVSISLAGNKIGDNTVVELIKAFKQSTFKNLTALNLSDTNISVSGRAVLEFLEINYQMTKLYLADNKLPEKVISGLAKLISKPSSQLKIVDIRICGISSKPMAELCESLRPAKLTDFLIGGNPVGKKAGIMLCSSLDLNTHLNVLNLRNCSLKKNTLIDLLKIIKKNTKLPLKSLDISGNDLSQFEVVEELANMITFNQSIEHLNLSRCQINSDKSIARLGKALAANETLLKLHLDSNRMGKQVVRIAEGIKNTNKIKELTLRHCEIDGKDMHEFLTTIGAGTSLEILCLEKNNGLVKQKQFEEKLGWLPPNLVIRV